MCPSTPSFKVRRAVPSDSHTLAEHNISMAYETERKRLDKETALKGVEAVLSDPSRGFYLVVEEEGIVGQCMITFEWSDWRCRNFWWIQSVFVKEGWRRQGVFTQLFEHIVEEAKREGRVAGLRLYVEKNNIAAQKAYLEIGMKRSHYEMFESDSSLI